MKIVKLNIIYKNHKKINKKNSWLYIIKCDFKIVNISFYQVFLKKTIVKSQCRLGLVGNKIIVKDLKNFR